MTFGHIHILGGGPAGLSAAYHARRAGLEFSLYEADRQVGGHCRTIRFAGHRFDTGAHRLHEEDPAVTEEIRALLGGRLLAVDAPSRIYARGRFIGFPLSPLDLMRSLDGRTLARAALDKACAIGRSPARAANFEEFAEAQYGRTLARLLLLDYSEKLWGLPARDLSPLAAGNRLKGLDLRTFLIEALAGRRRKARHLDGRFFYPEEGYGAITEALADAAGRERMHCGARVTSLRHDGERIRRIDVAGRPPIETDTVLSTLPLPLLVRMLRPPAPPEIRRIVDRLRFRHMRLAALTIARERFSPNASLYFPEPDMACTRIYEPKNRSWRLSPPGETLLVVEAPCWPGDGVASLSPDAFLRRVLDDLTKRGLLDEQEVLAKCTLDLANAYPVLENGYEIRVDRLNKYIGEFRNLIFLGRAARFEYAHLHNIFAAAKETIRSGVVH